MLIILNILSISGSSKLLGDRHFLYEHCGNSYMDIYVYMCVCVCIYTNTHTYMHTHICKTHWTVHLKWMHFIVLNCTPITLILKVHRHKTVPAPKSLEGTNRETWREMLIHTST